jgi:hypothetical protein
MSSSNGTADLDLLLNLTLDVHEATTALILAALRDEDQDAGRARLVAFEEALQRCGKELFGGTIGQALNDFALAPEGRESGSGSVSQRVTEYALNLRSSLVQGIGVPESEVTVDKLAENWSKIKPVLSQAQLYDPQKKEAQIHREYLFAVNERAKRSVASPDRSLEQMSPTARAIALMLDRKTATGKVPTIEEILLAIPDAKRSSLYRDPTFKAARAALKARSSISKGSKDGDGTIDAIDTNAIDMNAAEDDD